MRYSLIGVKKGDLLVNMDSQAPNKVCEEALLDDSLQLPGMGKLPFVKREKTFGDSRFDFYVEDENGVKRLAGGQRSDSCRGPYSQVPRCADGKRR